MARGSVSLPRVAVTGAAGMLGTALLDCLEQQSVVLATDVRRGLQRPRISWRLFDLTENDDLRSWLRESVADVVVHCAGIIDVDECERRPDLARAVHVDAAETIASVQEQRGAMSVYVSTDSVFDGTGSGAYVESDAPNPLNIYASSKVEGERAVLAHSGAVALRTNIFGWTSGGRASIAEWILEGLEAQSALRMFDDVMFSPINVSHLADAVWACIQIGASGLYHAGGGEVLSKFQFALEVADVFGLPTGCVRARSVEEAGLTAARPKNMALSSRRLSEALGVRLPGARDGLRLMRDQREAGWPWQGPRQGGDEEET